MSKRSVAKSERHVKAGKARHANLRERLGDAGYRAYQRAAGAAGEARQRAQGAAAYQATKRRGYLALIDAHGPEVARRALVRAHRMRRNWRIVHPTDGEAALRDALVAAGYTVHEDAAMVVDGVGAVAEASWTWDDLIREAQIGPYYVDFLAVRQRLVIEVDGGCHQLHQERDARRDAAIRALGFTVVRISNTAALAAPTVTEFLFRVLF